MTPLMMTEEEEGEEESLPLPLFPVLLLTHCFLPSSPRGILSQLLPPLFLSLALYILPSNLFPFKPKALFLLFIPCPSFSGFEAEPRIYSQLLNHCCDRLKSAQNK